MKINGREVIVKADFADMLDEIATWFTIYKILPARLAFLAIVYSKRDLSKLDFE